MIDFDPAPCNTGRSYWKRHHSSIYLTMFTSFFLRLFKSDTCCKEGKSHRRTRKGFLLLRKKKPEPPANTTITMVDRSVAKCDTVVGGKSVPFELNDIVRLRRLRKLWNTLDCIEETPDVECEVCVGRRFTTDVTVLVTDVELTYFNPAKDSFGRVA